MAVRLYSLLVIWLVTATLSVNAACDNYGIENGANCQCPPGVGGADCSLPVCGGTLYDGPSRPVAQPANGALYGNLSACSCGDGWQGVGCNVCTSASACSSAYTSHQTANIGGAVTGGDTGSIACSTTPRVYAVGQMSCTVNNPTIQALYSGKTTLNILRNVDPANTLAANVSSYGAAGTVHAQLWYEGEEEFFCNADTCTQDFSDGASTWSCHNLKCHCRENATFCGKVPATSITNVINDLNGDLNIKCTTQGDGSVQCAFIQQTISQVFGSSGLIMNNCLIGECVAQTVIDAAQGNASPTTTDSGSAPLSGGVIAGLAVVGALVGAFLLMFLWGWLVQRKARSQGTGEPVKNGGVAVTWSNVNYSIPTTSSTIFKKKGDQLVAGDKHVLHELSGEVVPGEMLAILGPSGAGKTTLIEILGGKSKLGNTTGNVTFSAYPPTEQNAGTVKQPRIGYVDQADILPSMLTVQEALTFAARLRLPEHVTEETKQAKVFEVMQQLGILDIKDTRIGNHERRGISGGEQRRVSIGLELVACPDVLVLDEPTSGLDSVSANKVVTVLRDLAHDPTNPTAIIASIHQPNSKLYQLFDKVLVLSHGKELYFGPGGLAPNDYFAQHGHPAQPGYNVADHLLDIASEPTDDLLGLARRKSQSRTSATVSPGGTDVGNGSKGNLVSGSDPEKAAIAGDQTPRSIPKQTKFGSSRLMSTYSTTFLTQLQVLCGREWKILKRDKSLFFAHLLFAAILGVFCGGLYFKTGITIAGFQSRIGCLFFLGSLLSFSALSALYNLIEIRPLFLRERAGLFYSPTAWLLSRFFFDVLPLRIVPTIVVSTIVYWMAGLAPDAAHYFKFLFILVLYTFAMTLFNFLLACTFRNGGIAILLSAIFNLFIMTFAGFFVHLNDIPEVLRWLQWFSLLKYCLEALAVNEVDSGLQIVDTLSGVPVNVSAQLIMNLLFGFGADNYYRDVLVLFAFIAGFGISLIGVVWLLVRERR
ncbi:hypothetical protein M408DRAFT_68953 [Serendipita vermifera MAFF 305830]|uniref:ABC transporter domain-containing protein n=1 Tax=Serendipita vermifera MAFF 305830 TaxID=933852 RepID=A0A0C3BBJ0_SERVB|nr:hypothetical protein M408DRAFT_68953 [Serendipita vermifera MAFF 305830]